MVSGSVQPGASTNRGPFKRTSSAWASAKASTALPVLIAPQGDGPEASPPRQQGLGGRIARRRLQVQQRRGPVLEQRAMHAVPVQVQDVERQHPRRLEAGAIAWKAETGILGLPGDRATSRRRGCRSTSCTCTRGTACVCALFGPAPGAAAPGGGAGQSGPRDPAGTELPAARHPGARSAPAAPSRPSRRPRRCWSA